MHLARRRADRLHAVRELVQLGQKSLADLAYLCRNFPQLRWRPANRSRAETLASSWQGPAEVAGQGFEGADSLLRRAVELVYGSHRSGQQRDDNGWHRERKVYIMQ